MFTTNQDNTKQTLPKEYQLPDKLIEQIKKLGFTVGFFLDVSGENEKPVGYFIRKKILLDNKDLIK
ncbi:MAG: hypothetical protein NTX22_06585 [Ignavibacteriales bacterium]|nr:hypothetical protein [Ignavibacteriales bacterium]